MRAGIIAPPIAHMIGSSALLGVESSPDTSSRFISSPTRRKKTDINPSLIQTDKEKFKWTAVFEAPNFVSSKSLKPLPSDELAIHNEVIKQAKSNTLPTKLELMNFWNTDRLMFFNIGVKVEFPV